MTTLERIMQFHNEMRELIITFAGVKITIYDKIVEKVDLYNEDEQAALLIWLQDLAKGAYKEVKRIYGMPPNPQNTWKQYALHGIEGLQEQLLMQKAAKELRKAWLNQYKPSRIIKRAKNFNQQTETQGSDSGISV